MTKKMPESNNHLEDEKKILIQTYRTQYDLFKNLTISAGEEKSYILHHIGNAFASVVDNDRDETKLYAEKIIQVFIMMNEKLSKMQPEQAKNIIDQLSSIAGECKLHDTNNSNFIARKKLFIAMFSFIWYDPIIEENMDCIEYLTTP